MPFISGFEYAVSGDRCILFAELIAPAPDPFRSRSRLHVPPSSPDFAKAHTKAEILPNAFGDDLAWNSVTTYHCPTSPFSIAPDRSGPM